MHLANSLLYHIYIIPAIFIYFVNTCFILDLHVNLDSFFSFVSIFNRVHCKTVQLNVLPCINIIKSNQIKSNPCSSLGVMNFQKWELFSGSPGSKNVDEW